MSPRDDYKARIRAALRASMSGWLPSEAIAYRNHTSSAKLRPDLEALVSTGELQTRMRGLVKEYALKGPPC